jgi:hypothetical protein
MARQAQARITMDIKAQSAQRERECRLLDIKTHHRILHESSDFLKDQIKPFLKTRLEIDQSSNHSRYHSTYKAVQKLTPRQHSGHSRTIVLITDRGPIILPRSPKRLQPPQQNRRPISDDDYPATSADNLQPPSPDYRTLYPSEEMFSPSSYRSSRPLTTSSAVSEASSLGSIPDFPVPQPPMPSVQQLRRLPSLGPPPSSRRGPSSYYTQMSYVSPIVEESDARSDTLQSRHGSFASSSVFPTDRARFDLDDELLSDDDDTITSDRGTISPTDENDRRVLVNQSPALVRQASVGRRTKPSLTTIRSVDSLGDRKGSTGKGTSENAGAATAALGVGGAILVGKSAKKPPSQQSSIRSNSSGLASSSSDSINAFRNMIPKAMPRTGSPAHPLQQEIRPTTLADRAGMRRPPKLDIDAVRDAEARGSLTSLPELIRRATQLAANLDRGKTASRLGLDFWEAGAAEKSGPRQSGLSDMLAAFPPPGQVTPLRSGTPNDPNSKWPLANAGSRAGATDSGMSNEKPRQRRRCCGMPMWTFVTLLIVLLFVIAAAVVIPVVLIVIPNQHKSNDSPSQANQGSNNNGNNNNNNAGPSSRLPVPTLAPGTGNNQCDSVITCQNGGISILNSDKTCNCVCINGFTGKTCTNNDATGCTTTSIEGAANNATMGTGISRLLSSAVDGFNIPLDSTRVLSLFSQLSLSCAAQNALITFNGLASRNIMSHFHAIDLKHTLEPTRSLPVLHPPHPADSAGENVKRQTVGKPGLPDPKAAQPSATSTRPISSNATALDFARVGVLFALQQAGSLDIAAKAQEAIQNLLINNRNGNNAGSTVDVGPFKMDLAQLTIVFSNGTTIRAS